MCKLCCDLETAKERIGKLKCNGVALGKTDTVFILDYENPIKATLWIDKEGTMKQKKTYLELHHTEDNEGNGVRLIYPAKYCPNCGRELIIK